MPRSQAEAIAKGFIDMSVHNFDELVTKDNHDSRFSEFESTIDLRLAEAENRTDGKFKDLESRMDLRFVALESKMDVRFARMNVIQGVILLALVIPVLQALRTWVG